MKNYIIDIRRTESSPTEPCTTTEAKLQAVITYSDDDTLISGLITKARKMVENYCNISIVAQTVTMIADLFNSWELPYGPVTGVTGVQTRTGNEGSGPGTYETQTSGWTTDGSQFLTFEPSGLGGFNTGTPYRGYDQWGPFASPNSGGVRYKLTYTTGYGTVPDDLKQAVLVQVAWLYEHRGEESVSICELAKVLADPYKRQLWS